METKTKVTKSFFLFASFMILTGSKCSSIPYQDDAGFLNSAQANSLEFLVTIDNVTCKDAEGFVGACTKRVRSNHDPILRHEAKPYSYTIDIRCTEGTGIGFSMDVPADTKWEYAIPFEKFADFLSFSCTGEIFPGDRENSVSAKWQIRFIVYDAIYKERELMYVNDEGFLILGKFSKYARVCQDGKCKDYEEKTCVKVDPKKKIVASSESEVLRYNYYGF